ncbi:UNVERIFIED_CONTAM: hypothetical protein GTU68_030814 [Idotea baltica]|nr:hypothetical protein [Idotea baltica]
MALNALDGMVAVAMQNKTVKGAVLNEVCDVIADAALFSAFLFLLNEFVVLWWLVTILALLIEFVSLAVHQANGIRSHSGPFGKSDRAVYLGLLAILSVIFPSILDSSSTWLLLYIICGVILALLTIWNRFKAVA